MAEKLPESAENCLNVRIFFELSAQMATRNRSSHEPFPLRSPGTAL